MVDNDGDCLIDSVVLGVKIDAEADANADADANTAAVDAGAMNETC